MRLGARGPGRRLRGDALARLAPDATLEVRGAPRRDRRRREADDRLPARLADPRAQAHDLALRGKSWRSAATGLAPLCVHCSVFRNPTPDTRSQHAFLRQRHVGSGAVNAPACQPTSLKPTGKQQSRALSEMRERIDDIVAAQGMHQLEDLADSTDRARTRKVGDNHKSARKVIVGGTLGGPAPKASVLAAIEFSSVEFSPSSFQRRSGHRYFLLPRRRAKPASAGEDYYVWDRRSATVAVHIHTEADEHRPATRSWNRCQATRWRSPRM